MLLKNAWKSRSIWLNLVKGGDGHVRFSSAFRSAAMGIAAEMRNCLYMFFFYKNNYIRTLASDFVKIKNNFRTIEPRTTR